MQTIQEALTQIREKENSTIQQPNSPKFATVSDALAAIQSGNVQSSAQEYTNTNDPITLLGALGLGAAGMANNTLIGGTGLALGNIGRMVESVSPWSGDPLNEHDRNLFYKLGYSTDEINKLVPYEDSWITSAAKGTLGLHNSIDDTLNNWEHDLLGDNPTFEANVAKGTGSSFGYMGAGAALSALSGGVTPLAWALGMGGSEALSEAGGFLADAYKNGQYDNGAIAAADKDFLANMALNTTLDYALSPFGTFASKAKTPLGRVARGMLSEQVNELLQEPSQQVIEHAATNSLNNGTGFMSELGESAKQWPETFMQLAPEVSASTALTSLLTLPMNLKQSRKQIDYENGYKQLVDDRNKAEELLLGIDPNNTEELQKAQIHIANLEEAIKNYGKSSAQIKAEKLTPQTTETPQPVQTPYANLTPTPISDNNPQIGLGFTEADMYNPSEIKNDNLKAEPVRMAIDDAPEIAQAGQSQSEEQQHEDDAIKPLEANKVQPKNRNIDRVVTANNTEVDVRYRVIDVDKLITSNNDNGTINPAYPQELQPRNRSSSVSNSQVEKIMRNIDPRRLGRNIMASDGAPIIGPDMVVESGNGRIMALRRAYGTTHFADNYKAWVNENAASFGLNPKYVAQMKKPVLVRERISEVDRVKFTSEANESSIAQMSSTEHAMDDAKVITPDLLNLYDFDRSFEDNGRFINHIIARLPTNEQGDLKTSDGYISKAGYERVRNALAAKAYKDKDILSRLTETYDDDIKNISNALIEAAPRIAAFEMAGYSSDISIGEDVAQAVKTLATLRRRGETVAEYLNQILMFDDGVSPEAKKLLRFFDENKRGWKRISQGLTNYVDIAMNEAQEGQGLLFADEAPKTKMQILTEAISHTRETPKTEEQIRQWIKEQILDINRSEDEAEALSHMYVRGNNFFSKYTGISLQDLVKADHLKFEYRPEIYTDQEHKNQARARIEFIPEKRNRYGGLEQEAQTLLRVSKMANRSSILHEMGHLFLKKFNTFAQTGQLKGLAKHDWQMLLESYGISDIDFKNMSEADNARWIDANEKWATDLERYMRTGEAPSNKIKHIFEAFKRWLTELYKSVKDIKYVGADGREHEFELSPQIKEIFDHMLGNDAEGSSEHFNQILGEQGARELDKREGNTYRIDNLNVAKEMSKAGKDDKTIRLATGWEIAPDGKWRYEISDGEIDVAQVWDVLKSEGMPFSMSLSEVYDNKELFDAYPELADMPVYFQEQILNGNAYGLYDPNDKSIQIDAVHRNDLDAIQSTLIHEIQHAIQDIEGFAFGGQSQGAVITGEAVGKFIYRFFDQLKKFSPEIQRAADMYYHGSERRAQKIIDKLSDRDKTIWSNVKEQLDHIMNGNYKLANIYNFLGGEVEARNTQTRERFTNEQRRNTPLSETQDRHEWLVDTNLRNGELPNYSVLETFPARGSGNAGSEVFNQAKTSNNSDEGIYNGFRLPFDPSKLTTESGRSIEEADKSEMLLSPDGSRNLGRIPEAIGDNKEFPAGNIQANAGAVQRSEAKHGDEIRGKNYDNSQTLLLDVLSNYSEIYQGDDKALILAVHGDNKHSAKSVIALIRKNGDGTYKVKDMGIARNRYFDNKKLLYSRRGPVDFGSDSEMAEPTEHLQRQSVSQSYARQKSTDSLPGASTHVNGNNNEVFNQIAPKRKAEMDKALQSRRPDMNEQQRTDAISEIEKLGESVRQGGNPKVEKLATKWLLDGHIILPEDNYKVLDAIKISEQQHFDPMQYDDPNKILAKYTIKQTKSEMQINPDTVPEFSDKVEYDHGITVYTVDDTEDGQSAVRSIIDTHWGEDANPWCLAARRDGDLSRAWRMWKYYSGTPKRIAFQNGKLLAFSASNYDKVLWWDREDNSTSGIPIITKSHGNTTVYSYDVSTGKLVKTSETLSDGTERSYYENGPKKLEKLPDGTQREWYKNGQLRVENSPDGMRREWYESGQLESKSVAGETLYFYKNGQLRLKNDYKNYISLEFYENGSKKLERLSDGTQREWYENGQLSVEDSPDGMRREWYESGQLKYESLSDGTKRSYYKNGQIKKESLSDGTWREYRENGRLKVEKLHDGTLREWYENGQLQAEHFSDGSEKRLQEFYENGKLRVEMFKDGTTRSFYENGTKKFEELPNGTRRWFYENGKLQAKERRHGVRVEFDEDGKKIQGFNQAMPADNPELNVQEQLDAVRAQYEGTTQWLKAPNGNKTELTEKQWLQVRTENFKQWFGDWENDPENASQVVDENGEPLPVYHGTAYKGFSVFNTDNGAWFTDSLATSDSYTHGDYDEGTYTVFLSMKNPLIIDYEGTGALDDYNGLQEPAYYLRNLDSEYDGVIAKNIKDRGGYLGGLAEQDEDGNFIKFYEDTVYGVKNPEQIKSIDNRGTFNSGNPDIYYQGYNDWIRMIKNKERSSVPISSTEPTSKVQNDNDLNFENEETERRYTEGQKGVPQPTIPQRVMKSTLNLLKSFRNPLHMLSGKKELLPAKTALEKLSRKQSARTRDAMKTFTENLKGLSDRQLNLFGRVRLLEDLTWRKQQVPNALLPFGFTDETLKKEYERFSKIANADPKVRKAIQLEEETMSKISKEFAGLAKELGLNLDNVFSNPHYYRHQILEYATLSNSGNRRTNRDGTIQEIVDRELNSIKKRGFLKHYKGSDKDINANYVQANAEVRAQMLTDIETMKTLIEIKKKYDKGDELRAKIKDNIKSKGKGESYSQGEGINLTEILPEGYSIYNPAGSRLIQSANSTTENIIAMALDDASDSSGLPLDEILNSIGQTGEEFYDQLWVVPTEIKETLKHMTRGRDRGMLGNTAKIITNAWKRAVLFTPTRNLKYNFRNFTGDLDAVIAGNPGALKYFGQSFRELTAYYRGKEPTSDLKDFIERSGGLKVETMQINDAQNQELGALAEQINTNGLKSIPTKSWDLIRKFFRNEVAFTEWRENLLRYTTYLAYKNDMEQNNGKPSSWGASIEDEVMALDDVKDRAFKMSNELLGDYENISEVGKQLREFAIPFWSWSEVNAKRYYRLLKNGFSGKNSSDFTKRLLVAQTAKIPFYALTAAETFGKITLLTMMIQAFNRTVMGDDDDELPEDVKYRPHLTLGKINGKVYYFDRIGALADNLDWLSLDSLFLDAKQLSENQQSLGGYMKKIARAPISKSLNSLNPLIKVPFELTTGRSIYPDAFNSRTIRDKTGYLASTLGLTWPYKAITRTPRNDWDELSNLILYSVDPDEAAYWQTLDKVRQFQTRVLDKHFDGFATTKRGEVLRKLKTAMRYNDKAAVRRYLKEYKQLDGTPKGLKSSLQAMDPLHGLSKEEKKQFMKWITADDRQYLRKAEKYYRELTNKYLK